VDNANRNPDYPTRELPIGIAPNFQPAAAGVCRIVIDSQNPDPAGRVESILLVEIHAKDLADRSTIKMLPEAGGKSKFSVSVRRFLTLLWPEILSFLYQCDHTSNREHENRIFTPNECGRDPFEFSRRLKESFHVAQQLV
jgi:hypothetical protein